MAKIKVACFFSGTRCICRRFNLSPFWLSYIIFDAVFSFVAVEFLRRYEKSENGTKSLVPCSSSGTILSSTVYLSATMCIASPRVCV